MKPYATPETLPITGYLPVEPISVRIPSAAKLTGLSRSTLYNLIKAGDLEVVKVGSMTLVPYDSLRRFIESRRASQK